MGDSSSSTSHTNSLSLLLLEKFQKEGRPSFVPSSSTQEIKEWQMCSKEEGYDRQQFMELSELECTNDTCYATNIKLRKVDPYKCISKYKRSAAGGGSSHERYAHVRPRSVVDLHVTTCYLLHTLVSTQSPPGDHNDKTTTTTNPFSTICNFVDDRIRAIQVEYVTHYMSSLLEEQPIFSRALERARHDKSLSLIIDVQMKCIRYHLLSQYLLRDAASASSSTASDRNSTGDCKSTTLSKSFELKFNFSALRTAITHGIDLLVCQCRRLKRQDQHKDQYDYYIKCLDEIISYQALLHFVGSIMTNCSGTNNILSHIQGLSTVMPWLFLECGTGLSAIESIFKDVIMQVTTNTSNNLNLFPRWKWTLDLAYTFENGNYIGFFKHLLHDTDSILESLTNDDAINKNTTVATTATAAAPPPVTTTTTATPSAPPPPPFPPTTTSLMAALQKAKSSQLPPKVAATTTLNSSPSMTTDTFSNTTIPIVTPPPSRTTSTAGSSTAIESNIMTTINDGCQGVFPQAATFVENNQRDTQSVPALIENNDHNDGSSNNATEQQEPDFKRLEKERWKMLCRSCLLPVLPLVRVCMLEHYNKTWMKHEKVSCKDLSNLLCLQHDKTIQLCQMVGLPIVSMRDEKEGSDTQQIQFKAVPMNVDTINVKQLGCLGRDDMFVFCGSRNTSSLCKKDGMSPLLDLDPSQWKQDQDHVIVPPKDVIDFLLV